MILLIKFHFSRLTDSTAQFFSKFNGFQKFERILFLKPVKI